MYYFLGKQIKRELDEEAEEEEGEEEEEDMKAGDDTEDNDDGAARGVVERRRSERRSNDKERSEVQDGNEDEANNVANASGFEDMYSRVKRQRTRRSFYDSALLNRRRQQQRKCIDGQGKKFVFRF